MITRNPVVTADSIVALFLALEAVALSFGWIDWNEAQMASIQNLLIIIAPVIVFFIGTWYKRAAVTPMAAPRTNDGQEAVIVSKELYDS